VDELPVVVVDPLDELDELDEPESDPEALVDSDDEPPFDVESVVLDPLDVDGFLPRLSVLKKPDPLNVTPTGVNTFLTGRTSPDSGCAYSVSVSSWNACWTSMVSPVSTNL